MTDQLTGDHLTGDRLAVDRHSGDRSSGSASERLTTAAFHRSERGGSPALVVLLALTLVGAAAVLSTMQPDQASRAILYVLALLAVVGIFALFGYAVGLFQVAGKTGGNDVTRTVCDTGPEGLLVTDAGGKFLYANDTYLRLSRARGVADLRGMERLLSGSPEVSEAVYRLAQAARDSKRALEEVRLSPPPAGLRAA